MAAKSQRGKGGGGIGPEETLVSYALNAKAGYRDGDADTNYVVAAPLSHGSNPNSNMAGRRREDDENLVAYPISADALRGEGTAQTPSADAEGRVRLRDPGFAIGDEGDPAFTLAAAGPGAVASGFYATGGAHGLHGEQGTSPPLKIGTGLGVGSANAVQAGASVRRLTPTECERLQGFPDGWTRVPDDAPDSRRYAALGDAVTVPVAEWIGRRLLAA